MANYTEIDDTISISFSTHSSYVDLKKEYILRLYNFISSCQHKEYFHCDGIKWIIAGNYIYTSKKNRQHYLNDLANIIKELTK